MLMLAIAIVIGRWKPLALWKETSPLMFLPCWRLPITGVELMVLSGLMVRPR